MSEKNNKRDSEDEQRDSQQENEVSFNESEEFKKSANKDK